MDIRIAISERLTELMENNELTNVGLSNKIALSDTTIGLLKNGRSAMKLSSALKLANYFNCSLDFLTGRSEKVLDFIPKECPPFYKFFREKIKQMGVTAYRINTDTNVTNSRFYDWSRGSDPYITSLVEIADYIGITLDELVGRDR